MSSRSILTPNNFSQNETTSFLTIVQKLTHHRHQRTPHLINPDVSAIAAKSVDEHLRRQAGVEPFPGPLVSLLKLVVEHFPSRRTASPPAVARVHQELRGDLFRFAGRHVDVPERAGCVEATQVGVAYLRILTFLSGRNKKKVYF